MERLKSKSSVNPSPFDPLSLLGCGVAACAAIAVFSNARFWWQIPIGAAAPWWFPILLLAACAQIRRFVSGRAPSLLTLIMVATVSVSAYQFSQPVFGLLKAPLDSSIPVDKDTYFSLSVLDEPVQGGSTPTQREYLEKSNDDVVVVFGGSGADLPNKRFPFHRDFNGNGIHFSVGTRFEWLSDTVLDFGDEALPAAAIRLQLPHGRTCWIAVLSLWESGDPFSFHINRLSLRRVGTLFRNTHEAGVLITDLKTPIFARYYGLLTRYGYLRNIWRGRLFDSNDPNLLLKVPFTGRQILVNRGIAIKDASILALNNNSQFLQSRVELGIRSE